MKFDRFISLGKPTELLICETDGFSLRAAVLSRIDDHVEVLYQAKTVQVNMVEGLSDVLSALKADGWKGGGAAVVLSPAVMSALVELPVNPKKPRPLQQMLELVRWEVEPLLMQHMTRWSVGYLLVGQGYMTEEQAQAVMDLQQGKPNAARGLAIAEQFSLRRFGELAVELGYIKRSQLNACLTGQEWLKADDELIECGWAVQGAMEDVPGTFEWLISCVNQSLLQRWATAFAQHGLKLQAMYPLTGCSAMLLPDGAEPAVVLEVHPGLGYGTRLLENGVVSQQQYLNLHKSPLDICLETYHALHAPSREPIWLAGWQEFPGLADDLRQILELEVHELSDASVGEVVTAGMAGAAYQVLGLTDAQHSVGVRVGGPLPPWRDRLEVRGVAMVLLLLTLLAGAEISLWLRKSSVEAVKQEVDAQWKSIDDAVKRIEAQIAEINQRKATLKQLKADEQRYEALLRFYDDEIPERIALVKGVLGVLQTVVGDEVVIETIDEPNKTTKPLVSALPAPGQVEDKRVEVENFKLEAWAISETAAQSFIQKVKDTVIRWDLQVRDPLVSLRKGPLNVNGFAVSMRLVILAGPEGKVIRQAKQVEHEITHFE